MTNQREDSPEARIAEIRDYPFKATLLAEMTSDPGTRTALRKFGSALQFLLGRLHEQAQEIERLKAEPTVTDRPVGEIDPRDRERAIMIAAHIRAFMYADPIQQIAEALSQVRQESQQEIGRLRVALTQAEQENDRLMRQKIAAEARLRELEGRSA